MIVTNNTQSTSKKRSARPRKSVRRRKPHWILQWLVVTGVATMAVSLAWMAWATNPPSQEIPEEFVRFNWQSVARLPDPIPPLASNKPTKPDKSVADQLIDTAQLPAWHHVVVENGDTLAAIFHRLEVPAAQLRKVMDIGPDTKAFKQLSPGQKLSIKIAPNGAVDELIYVVNVQTSIHVRRDKKRLTLATLSRDYQIHTAIARGEIQTSLFDAARESGLSENLILDMASIFGWDIDFALDTRLGDHFAVVYEELWLDGRKVKTGNILAAEYVTQGVPYRAVRYLDHNGLPEYYTPEGKNLRKAFLKSPVDFHRISSRFGNRFHPLLNRLRAHRGVDYAGPVGTPVKASGDGQVIYSGVMSGYGRTVVLKHGTTYSTLYAHMSGFARGLRTGSRVRQGQVIGYIGQSGLATGPHLHYEFRVDGVHRNPLTIKPPQAEPIQTNLRPAFESAARPLLAQLELVTTRAVATSQ